jgi:predicted RNase H-like HicB family nuclease
MELGIEFDRESDGRWIADVPDLPGVMAYGESREDARARVQALAAEVLSRKDRQQTR